MTRRAIGLVVLVGMAAQAPAQDKPADVVKAAVKAAGGEEVLKKYPAGSSTQKGTAIFGGQSLPFTGSVVYAVPGRIKMELVLDAGAQKVTLVQVVNKGSVRHTENGKVIDVEGKAKAELLQAAHLQEVALLYPLLDEKAYTLKAGFPTAEHDVVEVEGKDGGLKSVTLSFNKKTKLLDKLARKGLSPSGAEVNELLEYSDYKSVSGVMVPMATKVSHDGKLFFDIAVTEFKPLEKTDEKFSTGE